MDESDLEEIAAFLQQPWNAIVHSADVTGACRLVLERAAQNGSLEQITRLNPPVAIVAHIGQASFTTILRGIREKALRIVIVDPSRSHGRDALVGVIAHEFAHAVLQHRHSELVAEGKPSSLAKGEEGEIAADALASEWGCGRYLLESLRRDIAGDATDAAKLAELGRRVNALERLIT